MTLLKVVMAIFFDKISHLLCRFLFFMMRTFPENDANFLYGIICGFSFLVCLKLKQQLLYSLLLAIIFHVVEL
jgi:hypothetical protein